MGFDLINDGLRHRDQWGLELQNMEILSYVTLIMHFNRQLSI